MSNITIQCPSCQQYLEAPPEMAGALVACPACDHEFDIPNAEPAIEPAPAPEISIAPPEPALEPEISFTPPTPPAPAPPAASGEPKSAMQAAIEAASRATEAAALDAASEPGATMPASSAMQAAIAAAESTLDKKPATPIIDVSQSEAPEPTQIKTPSEATAPATSLEPPPIGSAEEPEPPAAEDPAAGNICPECNAEMTPGSVLCIGCGFNTKTGQKMATNFS